MYAKYNQSGSVKEDRVLLEALERHHGRIGGASSAETRWKYMKHGMAVFGVLFVLVFILILMSGGSGRQSAIMNPHPQRGGVDCHRYIPENQPEMPGRYGMGITGMIYEADRMSRMQNQPPPQQNQPPPEPSRWQKFSNWHWN